jgi:8-oxo-dGTP diphosphatase
MSSTKVKEDASFQEPLTVRSVLDGNFSGITLNRPRVIVDVNLLVVSNGTILLTRRCNTGFADGLYSLPAGHMDLGESVVAATVREAREELGIVVSAEDLRFVQVMHNSYGIGRLAFFFEIQRWTGHVTNMEPSKCDDVRWFDLARLPENVVPHIRAAIQYYLHGQTLTLFGW